MSDEIIKILNAVCNKIGIAVDWSNQNIVPHAKDLLHRCNSYLLVHDIFWVALWLIIGVLAIVCLTKSIKELNNYNDYDICDWEMVALISCIIIGISLVGLVFKSQDLIQSIFLPEMRLFEYYKSITG